MASTDFAIKNLYRWLCEKSESVECLRAGYQMSSSGFFRFSCLPGTAPHKSRGK
jgi:hypothetical protein